MSVLARLYQPRNPAFWLILVLNGLSAILAWLVRTYEMAFLPGLIVTAFAIGNAVLGAWLAWRLIRSPAR